MTSEVATVEENWPRTFRYRLFHNNLLAPSLICGWFCLPALFFVDPKIRAGIMSLWTTTGLVGTLWACAPFVLIQLLYLYLMLPHLSLWWEASRKLKEKIAVTPEELTWSDGAVSKTVRWSEVSRYYLRPSGPWRMSITMVVEGPAEKVQWTAGIRKLEELMALTRRFATRAQVAHWSDPEKRRGSQPGEIIFNYRAASWLKLLLFGLLMDFFMVWALLRGGKGLAGLQANAIFLALIILPVIWGWWRYFQAKVSLRPDGICHATAFGERFMPWHEVRDAHMVGGNWLLRVRGTASTFWIVPTGEWMEELHDTINTRAARQTTALNTPPS